MSTTKQFHLLGEDASTARAIEIPTSSDFADLQDTIASHFAIVLSQGM